MHTIRIVNIFPVDNSQCLIFRMNSYLGWVKVQGFFQIGWCAQLLTDIASKKHSMKNLQTQNTSVHCF
jgi:hypothetical protein